MAIVYGEVTYVGALSLYFWGALVPIRLALEGFARGDQQVFVQGSRDERNSNRQVVREAAGDGNRRQSRQVSRRNNAAQATRLRADRFGPATRAIQRLADLRRYAEPGGREQHVDVEE